MSRKYLPDTRAVLLKAAEKLGARHPDRLVESWLREGTWELIWIFERLRACDVYDQLYSGALMNRIKAWKKVGLTVEDVERTIEIAQSKKDPQGFIGHVLQRQTWGELPVACDAAEPPPIDLERLALGKMSRDEFLYERRKMRMRYVPGSKQREDRQDDEHRRGGEG